MSRTFSTVPNMSTNKIWVSVQYVLTISGQVLFAMETWVAKSRPTTGMPCVCACVDLLWGETRAQAQPQGWCDPAVASVVVSGWLGFSTRTILTSHMGEGGGEVSQHFSEWEGPPWGLLLSLA